MLFITLQGCYSSSPTNVYMECVTPYLFTSELYSVLWMQLFYHFDFLRANTLFKHGWPSRTLCAHVPQAYPSGDAPVIVRAADL